MQSFLGMAAGLVVLGLVAAFMSGSIVPLIIIALVIAVVGSMFGGPTRGGRR